MTADLMTSQLLRLSIFRGLSLHQLREIARNTQPLPCSPGAVIIEENAEADAAVLIVDGEARRVSGPELKSRSEVVPIGSLLGESAMLVETHYGSTVVAHGHVIAARITREHLHEQIISDPTIGERMLANLAGRLRRLLEDLEAVDATLAGEEGVSGAEQEAVAGPVAQAAARLAAPAA